MPTSALCSGFGVASGPPARGRRSVARRPRVEEPTASPGGLLAQLHSLSGAVADLSGRRPGSRSAGGRPGPRGGSGVALDVNLEGAADAIAGEVFEVRVNFEVIFPPDPWLLRDEPPAGLVGADLEPSRQPRRRRGPTTARAEPSRAAVERLGEGEGQRVAGAGGGRSIFQVLGSGWISSTAPARKALRKAARSGSLRRRATRGRRPGRRPCRPRGPGRTPRGA